MTEWNSLQQLPVPHVATSRWKPCQQTIVSSFSIAPNADSRSNLRQEIAVSFAATVLSRARQFKWNNLICQRQSVAARNLANNLAWRAALRTCSLDQ